MREETVRTFAHCPGLRKLQIVVAGLGTVHVGWNPASNSEAGRTLLNWRAGVAVTVWWEDTNRFPAQGNIKYKTATPETNRRIIGDCSS